MLGVPGIAARTFEALYQQGISVSLISQSSSEQSICFSVPEAAAKRARDRLTEEFRERDRARRDRRRRGCSRAWRRWPSSASAWRATSASRRASSPRWPRRTINIVAIAQGSSELNISFVVAAKDAAAAQRAIHGAFQLSKIGGGAAARAAHTDAVLLGFGQIGRALAEMIAKANGKATARAAATNGGAGSKLRLVAAIDRSGFVFDPNGLSPRTIAALVAAKAAGKSLAELPGGRAAPPAEALALRWREHALGDPILVDVTADDTHAAHQAGAGAGHGRRARQQAPALRPARRDARRWWRWRRAQGARILTEATVGAGLPIFDTHRKLAESGDRVLKIEGCLSGTLGFLLTEVGRGQPFSAALRKAMELGYTEPDPRDDLSGVDVGRKALILGRLLGFAGEPSDVAVESLVPRRCGRCRARHSSRGSTTSTPTGAAPRRRRQGQGGQLRYVASVTKERSPSACKVVDRSSPFFGLKGTDNQVAFTTSRYRRTRWSSPAPAPARPSPPPACSTTCSASAADRYQRPSIAAGDNK